MSDSRIASTDRDASEKVISCNLMDNNWEAFGAKEEETRTEGVALAKTSRRDDVSISNPIYKNLVGDWCDALHDEVHPFRTETKFFHNSLNKAPFNPIKGLTNIELGYHKPLFPYRFVI